MRKALFLVMSILMLSVGTLFAGYWGDFKIPTDRSGSPAKSIEDCGVYAASLRYSSGPVLLIQGSSIAIYGVLTATKSVAANGVDAFVELRSTNTANFTSEYLVPPIAFSSDSMNTFIQYDPPVVCLNGLSVNVSTANDAFVTVFYRYLSTTNEQDYYIPYDKNGVKAYGSDFYGVRPASFSYRGITAINGLDWTTDEKMVHYVTTYALTTDSPGYLIGMIVSSASTSGMHNWVVFRDTCSVDGTNSADILLPPIFYNNWNLRDVLINTGKIPLAVTSSKEILFPWPIIYSKGLSQKRGSATDRFRVLYRPSDRLR